MFGYDELCNLPTYDELCHCPILKINYTQNFYNSFGMVDVTLGEYHCILKIKRYRTGKACWIWMILELY